MTSTRITSVEAAIPTEYYGDFGADFDTAAIDRAYCQALEDAARELVDSVQIYANGEVIADVEDVRGGV